MKKAVSITVERADGGMRADVFLVSKLAGFSRSSIKRLMDSGCVMVDKNRVTPHHKTRAGEEFRIEIPEARPIEKTPEDIPLDIVYQDADVAVVNKAAGMVVHPAKGHPAGTLVNALLFHLKDLSGIGGEIRPGIVHRLDKDTTGLIAVAKNDKAHLSLSEQLKSRTMKRGYLAVVRGVMKNRSGRVEKPIGRHPVYRKKVSVRTRRPREALTEYETLETFQEASYVRVTLRTGRTHQIRVHMSSIGHPILGDTVYGKDKTKLIARPALHAARLSFSHPESGKVMEFSAPLPQDFEKLLAHLRGK